MFIVWDRDTHSPSISNKAKLATFVANLMSQEIVQVRLARMECRIIFAKDPLDAGDATALPYAGGSRKKILKVD